MKQIETPKTFTLISPVKAGEKEITEVELREPTAHELAKFDRDSRKDGLVTAAINMIAKQTRLPPVDVGNFGARDFDAMQEYIGSFLGQTSKESES